MMVKYCLRGVASLCVALALAACNVGLGQEVDLEGPVLILESHQNLDFVSESSTLSGTVTDNQEVKRVEIWHVVSVGPRVFIANAAVSGTHWSANISLPEGEQTIEIVAYDHANNTSHRSKITRTLLVDTTAPFVDELALVRKNGTRGKLMERSALEALDENDKGNSNSFHNGYLKFEAVIAEQFSLDSVSLHLYDEIGNPVLSLANSASNDYAPEFELSHADLVAANPAWEHGLSYFRVTIEANDQAANNLDPDAVNNIDQFGWFAWYPEADTPHIIQSVAVAGAIEINAGNSLFFDFWDDDELDTVHVGMMSPSDWTAISDGDDAARLAYLEANETARANLLGPNRVDQAANTFGVNFPVGDTSGEYRLVAMTRDLKDDGMPVLWTSRVYTLHVSDEDAPVTFIESPVQNSVPGVDAAGDFSIEGYALDNRGAAALYAAWIPDGSGITIAEAQDALEVSTLAPGGKETLNGLVVRRLVLSTAPDREVNGITYKQSTFSLDLNIFTDFNYEGVRQNAQKTFVFYTCDADGNKVYQSFRLQGDTSLPVLSGVLPADDLQVHNIENDLILSFSALKPSGLHIDTMTIEDYTDPKNPQALAVSRTGNTASVTRASASLAEGRFTYRYTATDALGNTSVDQRTVIISALPELEYISSSRNDGIYKAGDVIMLQAVFSKAVKVTGSPRLCLRYSTTDTQNKYASYTSGSGTNTLYFSWTVPSGVESAELRSHAAPIDLDGGSIQTPEGNGGPAFIAGIDGQPALAPADTLHGRKDLALDGIAPSVLGLDLPASGTVYRAGQSFGAALEISEPVLVAGSPALLFTGNAASSIPAGFRKVSGSDILFDLAVQYGQNAANLAYDLHFIIAESQLPYITDYAGNPLVRPAAGIQNTGIIIDTIAPAQLTVSGIADGTLYTGSARTISLGNLEAGSTRRYSLDGGVSWNAYSGPVLVSTDGEYTFVAWQEDTAGNRSPSSTPISFELDISLPSVTGVSCETPDGSYGAGTLLRFKLAFSEKVRTTAAGASITLGSGAGAKTIAVTQNATGAASLVFDYTVAAGDNLNPLTVSAVNLSNIVDLNGNAPASVNPAPPDLLRPGLSADAVEPFVVSRTPSVDEESTPGLTEIELVFDGDVFKESGEITVERAGNWYIPIVLTEAEFAKWYYSNELEEADRQALMLASNGSPILDRYSGLPVGPYRKLTHGLVESGGAMVPDSSTKYVLDFSLSPADNTSFAYDRNGDGDTSDLYESVAAGAIRAALEKAGFHRHSVELASSAIVASGASVIITLPTVLADGREWTVTVPAGAFRDAAGNLNDEIVWNFWSGRVATPVIRVNRYSQGEGATQPLVTGFGHDGTGVVTFGTITGYQSFGARDKTRRPSGFVELRVDCETPGAVIRYGARLYSSEEIDTVNTTNLPKSTDRHSRSANADIPLAALDALVCDELNVDGMYFAVGDGEIDTSCKYYIAAEATRGAGASGPALTASNRGAEGAFKTVVMYRSPGGDNHPYTRFQGTNVMGGMPTVAGFPLRDADPDLRFTKHSYNTGIDWYWLSWEIVCDWWTHSTRQNWQTDPNLIENSYGEYLYTINKTYYGGGSWTDQM